MLSIQDVQGILNIDLLGVVPEDEKVLQGGNKGEPVVMNRSSAAGTPSARSCAA